MSEHKRKSAVGAIQFKRLAQTNAALTTEIERLLTELKWVSEQRWNHVDIDEICNRVDRALNTTQGSET